MKMSDLKKMDSQTIANRKIRIDILEGYLSSGKKPNNGDPSKSETLTAQVKENPKVSLNAEDISRFKKELAILKSRI